jgi:hypothetical protein
VSVFLGPGVTGFRGPATEFTVLGLLVVITTTPDPRRLVPFLPAAVALTSAATAVSQLVKL